MALTSWQKRRVLARQPYVPKLVIFAGTLCHLCRHPRSSHSTFIVAARCKAFECDCPCFEPMCGCGHLLCSHTWGSGEDPWGCYQCNCRKFGATRIGQQ